MPGECFPIGALLAHRPVQTVARAAEDTFCFELDVNCKRKRRMLLCLGPVFENLPASTGTKRVSTPEALRSCAPESTARFGVGTVPSTG